jgi:hypothetical protein
VQFQRNGASVHPGETPAWVMTAHPGPAEACAVIGSHSRQRYEIVVRGRLSSRLECAFDGVTFVPRNGQTTLSADLVDRSQLYGLLNRLRDLGIELVSVNPVSEPDHAA